MVNIVSRFILVAAVFAIASCSKQPEPVVEVSDRFDLIKTPVGDVSFPNDCNADAAPLIERGVALLHHMMYDEANFVFEMANDRDPECGLAYWGQAMALIHPLWPDRPTVAQFERGERLVEKSLEAGGHSDRENAYIETTRAYFENGQDLGETERLRRYYEAWRALSDANPQDLEARAFHSLALRATADPKDLEYLTNKSAGAIAESVLAESGNHPGAHHYIIHAYDAPGMSDKAVTAADHYGEITPRVPHATHMMTHIYTRLGQWDKAIEWNAVATDAAWEICEEYGEINTHYTHALDYLAYAQLQKGNDAVVLEYLGNIDAFDLPYSETNRNASAYTFAALPARFALERRDWQAAADLVPRTPANFPWETEHDAYVAITYFARALAKSRLGRPDDATIDIKSLAALHASVSTVDPYWALQIKIQEQTALAWQTYARGDVDAAVAQMEHAVDLAASTDKHGITPGDVLPAAELYADMLLDIGRYDDALQAYESALGLTPMRYNSLYGAGKAAIGSGDTAAAKAYYAQLLSIIGDSSESRRNLAEIRAFSEG